MQYTSDYWYSPIRFSHILFKIIFTSTTIQPLIHHHLKVESTIKTIFIAP